MRVSSNNINISLAAKLGEFSLVDAINPSAFQPDALIMTLANTVHLPNQGAAPGWPTLHRTVANVLMDTLEVSACLSKSALTTQRRNAPTLLAPGAPTTPLDALVGCCSWSLQALQVMNTVTNYGLLVCLPSWSFQRVLAALRKINNPQDRCAVLEPWETTLDSPTPAQIQRNTDVTCLLRVGYVAAILIPPALILIPTLVPTF
jgi:hypothetical protein